MSKLKSASKPTATLTPPSRLLAEALQQTSSVAQPMSAKTFGVNVVLADSRKTKVVMSRDFAQMVCEILGQETAYGLTRKFALELKGAQKSAVSASVRRQLVQFINRIQSIATLRGWPPARIRGAIRPHKGFVQPKDLTPLVPKDRRRAMTARQRYLRQKGRRGHNVNYKIIGFILGPRRTSVAVSKDVFMRACEVFGNAGPVNEYVRKFARAYKPNKRCSRSGYVNHNLAKVIERSCVR